VTREFKKKKHETKKYSRPLQAFAIDLVDMSNLATRNRNWKYILTVLDLYTKNVWFRKLKRKLATHVDIALRNIMGLIEHPPGVIISDQGGEFNVHDFYVEFNIKHKTSNSYTPIVDIERLNRTLRKNLRELFVRNRNLVWFQDLDSLENNRNIQVNATYTPPPQLPANNATALYAVDDTVRLKSTVLNSTIRKNQKTNLQKQVIVTYSVEVYTIRVVYRPNFHNGFFSYSIKDENNNTLYNDDDHILRVKEHDIMKITATDDHLTAREAAYLNRL